MKHRILVIVCSCVILLLFCVCLNWIKAQCSAPIPEPSVRGGYYEDAFVLKLTAPANGHIYYTTDGSTPTTSSNLYSDGIFLQDRSQEPNVYTSIQNVMEDWKTFTPDPTPVEKGTVVRAVFVNDWGIPSQVLTQTYFIGTSKPEAGYTLSLIFEYDDLFGEDGIHVTGKAYDTWYLSEEKTDPAPVPNFYQHLEATAIAELMDASGDVFLQPVSLRIQGNSARGWYKKRFTIESQTELSGSSIFSGEIFADTATHSVMTKACPVDAMVSELVAGRAVSVQKSVPARVFLNGEYWFDVYLLERYDNQYFREYYGVENVMLVKDGVVDDAVSVDTDIYGEFMNWIACTDFSEEAQWAQLKKEVDLQSYIDYITINYYLGNWDFSEDKNYVLWRSIADEDSPYADKRWRWCIYDIDALEYTLGNYDLENAAELNIFSCDLPYSDVTVEETVLFRSFCQNPEFRQQFVLSFMDIVNNHFAVSKVAPILAAHGLTLDWMDGYFQKRPDYAAQHLAAEFDLSSLETVTLTVNAPEMGKVIVNTSQIDLSSGSWSGKYFSDYPITITAIPNDGYQFLGWKGDADEAAPTLTVSVAGGIALQAMFAKER